MKLTAELTQAELVAIVEAVFEYNRKPAASVQIVDANGTPLEGIRILVDCDQPGGLEIRVAPEDECQHTPEQIARFFSVMEPSGNREDAT